MEARSENKPENKTENRIVYISQEELTKLLAQPRRYLTIPIDPNRELWGTIKNYCEASYHVNSMQVAFYHAYRAIHHEKRRREEITGITVQHSPGAKSEKIKGDESDEGADADDVELARLFQVYLQIREAGKVPRDLVTGNSTDKISNYYHVRRTDRLTDDLESIIAGGKPIMALVHVHETFQTSRSVTWKLPSPQFWQTYDDPSDACLGAIAVCLVGYSRDKQMFTAEHSLGQYWGTGGFCYIPYAYVSNPYLGLEFAVIDVC